MTDILHLQGWKALETRLDGDEYEIEAEYTITPDVCPKCGVVGNLYKHGPKPVTIRDSPIRGHHVRILLLVGLVLTLLGCAIFAMLALGVDITSLVDKFVQYVKHLI